MNVGVIVTTDLDRSDTQLRSFLLLTIPEGVRHEQSRAEF